MSWCKGITQKLKVAKISLKLCILLENPSNIRTEHDYNFHPSIDRKGSHLYNSWCVDSDSTERITSVPLSTGYWASRDLGLPWRCFWYKLQLRIIWRLNTNCVVLVTVMCLGLYIFKLWWQCTYIFCGMEWWHWGWMKGCHTGEGFPYFYQYLCMHLNIEHFV